MNIQLYINSIDKTEYVISYEKSKRLCGGTGILTIILSWNCPLNFTLYNPIELYENGTKKGTYVVGSIFSDAKSFTHEITCYDNAKLLNDFFIDEVYEITYLSTTRYWIEYFLQMVGIDYNINTSESGTYISINTSLGTQTAWEQIIKLVQQSGWYLYFDANNVAQIGKIEIDTSNYDYLIEDENILDFQRETSDTNYRNKAIVWGNSSPVTQRWVFATADWHGRGDNEYNENDVRAVVLSNGDIPSVDEAAIMAGRMVKEFAQIDNIFTLTLVDAWDFDLTDTVYIHSKYYSGLAKITTISSKFSAGGLITEITCNERCPRIFGYWGFSGYVYVGTEGNGIWRKPLKINHTWTNYSNGLSDLNITDLAIQNGVFATVTQNGELYVRELIDSYWHTVSVNFLDESDNTIYEKNSVNCIACTIDKIDNSIIAAYNLDDPEKVRSWIVKFNPVGRIISNDQIRVLSNISTPEFEEYFYDFNAIDLDNVGIGNYIVTSGNAVGTIDIGGINNIYYERPYYNGISDASPVFEGNYTLEQIGEDFHSLGITGKIIEIRNIDNYVYIFTLNEVAEVNLDTHEFQIISNPVNAIYYTGAKNNRTAYIGSFEGGVGDVANFYIVKYDFNFGTSLKTSKTNTSGSEEGNPLGGGLVGNKFFMVSGNESAGESGPAYLRCFYYDINWNKAYTSVIDIPATLHGKDFSGTVYSTFELYDDRYFAACINDSYGAVVFYPKYNIIFDEETETWLKYDFPFIVIFHSKSGTFSFTTNIADEYINLAGEGLGIENIGYTEFYAPYLTNEKDGNVLGIPFAYMLTDLSFRFAVCRMNVVNSFIINEFDRADIGWYYYSYQNNLNRYLWSAGGSVTGRGFYDGVHNRIVYWDSLNENIADFIGEKILLDSKNKLICYHQPATPPYDNRHIHYGEASRYPEQTLSLSEIPHTIDGYTETSLTYATDFIIIGNNKIIVVPRYKKSGLNQWSGRLYVYWGTESLGNQIQLLYENNGLFVKTTDLAYPLNVDASQTYPLVFYGGYYIPGSGTWGDPSYSAGVLWISADGTPGSFSSVLIENAHEYVPDARVFSVLDQYGESKHYVLFPQILDNEHSQTQLSALDISTIGNYGMNIIESGIAVINTTDLLTINGYGSKIEATNIDENPYLFMSVEAAITGGSVENFYQRDAYSHSQTPTEFIDRKGNLDANYKITIIRCDDMI